MMFESRLSEAICIYTGYGRHPIPALHPDELDQALGPERARDLKIKADEILTFACRRTVGAEIDLPNIGRDAALAVRREYWGMSKRALKAIAWYVTHHWQ